MNVHAPETIIIPSGSNLFQYSKSLSELLACGRFDPRRGSPLYHGAMFFTEIPTLTTNCAATAEEDLELFCDYEAMVDGTIERDDSEELDGSFAGKCYPINTDLHTTLSDGSHAREIIIFANSLHKISSIRPFDSAEPHSEEAFKLCEHFYGVKLDLLG